MNKYRLIRLFSIKGVPVYVHWPLTVILILFVLGGISDISLLVGAVSFWGVMLLHEAGHMYMAHRYGLSVDQINLSLVHGACCVEKSGCDFENYMVAWGGVLAQALVFIPSILVLYLIGDLLPWYLFTPLTFFGYVSAMIAIVNVVPTRGLDGHTCWKAIPIYFSRLHSCSKSKKKRPFKVVGK